MHVLSIALEIGRCPAASTVHGPVSSVLRRLRPPQIFYVVRCPCSVRESSSGVCVLERANPNHNARACPAPSAALSLSRLSRRLEFLFVVCRTYWPALGHIGPEVRSFYGFTLIFC